MEKEGVKTLCCVQIKTMVHFKFILREIFSNTGKSGCHMQKVTCVSVRFGLPLRKNLMNILRTGGLKEESFPKFPLVLFLGYSVTVQGGLKKL